MYDGKYLPEDFNAEKMKEAFEDKYEMLCATNKPFHVKMEKIYKIRDIDSEEEFEERTELHKKFFREFIKPGYIPKMKTFVTVCMGLDIDFVTAESLLDSLSVKFDRTDRLHCAYMFLINNYQGLNIIDANKILKDLGFCEEKQLLGSFGKEERKNN